ncbi:FmdB family zinc ribbon protein [Paraburkholderia sp.]|uniref:FmdB family zinc ribbon protein n=1 Tax=Paraburkholderia sp. TaxID=1926495 RepID=UPI0039E5C423
MPIYSYRCATCGPFDLMRRVDARDLPADCPACGTTMHRIPNGLPVLPDHADDQSAGSEGSYLAKHRRGCGCCG